jgi:glycerate dehydrogenase
MTREELQIVVLDGFTMNPGDLSWQGLEALGRCTIYERTPPDDVVPRAQGAQVVLTNKTILTREVIQELPRLQYIGVLATGYNVVDVDAARDRGIPVTNVPAYGTDSVAQMVFAHLLGFTQRVSDHAQSVRNGRWTECLDFCYWEHPLVELAGQTMGIVGYGRTGQATGRLAEAFGMSVLVYDRGSVSTPTSVRRVDLETLFRESDVVSLHCPLTAETERLVNRERLALMKKTAFLINTSRGPVVDEEALAEALNSGSLAGAGLDVLAREPPPKDNPLIMAKNCQITPHISWATRASRLRLMQIAVENIAAFLAGRPQNVVD